MVMNRVNKSYTSCKEVVNCYLFTAQFNATEGRKCVCIERNENRRNKETKSGAVRLKKNNMLLHLPYLR